MPKEYPFLFSFQNVTRNVVHAFVFFSEMKKLRCGMSVKDALNKRSSFSFLLLLVALNRFVC